MRLFFHNFEKAAPNFWVVTNFDLKNCFCAAALCVAIVNDLQKYKYTHALDLEQLRQGIFSMDIN